MLRSVLAAGSRLAERPVSSTWQQLSLRCFAVSPQNSSSRFEKAAFTPISQLFAEKAPRPLPLSPDLPLLAQLSLQPSLLLRSLPVSLPPPLPEGDVDTLECANRSPLARVPKPANKGARPRCVVMRKLRKRARTGR
ncbi:unnamed protein product [Polarella glacialis]|uniref:Uncharacterized protein n=1 Tax=Polarella glacialis TaxID=89957 RepID=A0A813GLZ2_POLGL|nr:unnamed protein product [Polarella glacialis]